MLKKLVEFMSEDNGNLSSMRLLVAFVVVVVMLNWSYINYHTGVLHGFDWQDVGALLGPFGAKAWQKGKEGGDENEG